MLLSFELMPPKVERWRTSEPSVACACEITPSICSTRIGRTVQNKTTPFQDQKRKEFERRNRRKSGSLCLAGAPDERHVVYHFVQMKS